jgi:hypothetical protein
MKAGLSRRALLVGLGSAVPAVSACSREVVSPPGRSLHIAIGTPFQERLPLAAVARLYDS